MGLINKTVVLKWNGKIKRHYEERGYVYTKMGDEFEVKVEDLTSKSFVEVDIVCDGCNKEIKNAKWCDYTRSSKEDGSYYCSKCARKLYGAETLRKTLLKKNGTSFKDWCIKNNRIDVLDRWDYELNNCDPSETCFGANKKYYFKCPKGIHRSELKHIGRFTNGQEGSTKCNACNSFAQYLIDLYGENALQIYWDYEKNKDINPWNIDKNSTKYVYIYCQEKAYHGSYRLKANKFVYGRRCSYCHNFKVHYLDSLGTLYPQVLEIWSDKNKKSAFEYSYQSNQDVWLKCSEGLHDDYYRKIQSSVNYQFRCPECVRERRESLLQESVRLYLNELGYESLHENNCSIVPRNPKTNQPLPFDNEVVELRLIIEVHGQQHYDVTGFHTMAAKRNNTTPEYELHHRKLKDRYKRICAKINGYNYLEIPYWTDDKNEAWKQLINDKIKEILKTNK